MKKYLKVYLIFIIFLLFCTGCNKSSKNFIDEKAITDEDDLINSEDLNRRFDTEDIKFGPEEIRFGAE